MPAWLTWVAFGAVETIRFLTRDRERKVGTQREQGLRVSPARLRAGPDATIFGRARTEGRLVWQGAPVRERLENLALSPAVHQVVALSNGAVDGIEAVWLQPPDIADRVRFALVPERDYLFRDSTTDIGEPTDGDADADIATDTEARVLPPGVVMRFSTTNQYNTDNSQWRLLHPLGGRNAPALPAALFTDAAGPNPRFARAQWRLRAGTLTGATLQLAFLSDTQGGGFGGPDLREPGNYSLVLRTEGETERFPVKVGEREPYDLELTAAQIQWLLRFPRLPGQAWDLAIIDHSQWDSRIWGRWEFAFENRTSAYTETGRLLVDAPGDLREALRFTPYLDPSVPAPQRWASVRLAGAGLPTAERWTEEHRLDGVAGVHVEIIQPGVNYWATLPDVEFLVRGRRIAWPGQAEPEWTENAAVVMWAFLTEFLGVSPARIDLASFRSAVARCGEVLRYELPPKPAGQDDAFSGESLRYSANGIVYGDDDLERVRQELQFAMGGRVLRRNGVWRFVVGEAREPVLTIRDSDLLGEPETQLGIPEGAAVAGVQMVLAQSREHDWAEIDLPPTLDRLAAEGEVLELSPRAFVADPLLGHRLAAQALRRESALELVSLRLPPGPRLRNHGWGVGDPVRLFVSRLGEHGSAWEVTQHEIEGDDEDLTVRMVLRPAISWEPDYGVIPSRLSEDPGGGDPFVPDDGPPEEEVEE